MASESTSEKDLTDEQVLDAYFEHGGIARAARALNRLRSTINRRIVNLRAAGVNVPILSKRGRGMVRLTPERVQQLNEYVRRKTEGKNFPGQG